MPMALFLSSQGTRDNIEWCPKITCRCFSRERNTWWHQMLPQNNSKLPQKVYLGIQYLMPPHNNHCLLPRSITYLGPRISRTCSKFCPKLPLSLVPYNMLRSWTLTCHVGWSLPRHHGALPWLSLHEPHLVQVNSHKRPCHTFLPPIWCKQKEEATTPKDD
jgi:hypothetical protein